MRNTSTFLFVFCLSVATSCLAQKEKSELFSCTTSKDCALHEEMNCCMPWITAVNKEQISKFEERAAVERQKYEATNCFCSWQSMSRVEHLQCIEKVGLAIKCLNGKCELPFKDSSSALNFCKDSD